MPDVFNIKNININNQPVILDYWVTGNISPVIKDKHIKIIIKNNDTKLDKKNYEFG